uniref:sensor histidine kinase n=1 Tax=Ningiella ruwaisensis TaxID=2364274 RepID=UPI0010A04F79|nr:histidine kinase [Ningiella ruwaisensis]
MPKHLYSLPVLSGFITWLVVSGLSINVMLNNDFSLQAIGIAACLYLIYVSLWLLLVSDDSSQKLKRAKSVATVVMFCVVIGIYFAVPLSFNSILMGILCGALPYLFTIRTALIIGSLWSLPLYFVFRFYWNDEHMFVTALLFWTFNMFAITMIHTTLKEQQAKEKAEESNRQLVSMQALLNEASKQSERVRIARNIHDLLGHHLTALSINLQVASLQSEGEVKANIEKCHGLAKLLLSDVREAVSDIRNKGEVDLKTAIHSIVEQVPNLEVDVNIAKELHIEDIHIADTIIKCIQESITNTLRHARGKHLDIDLSASGGSLVLDITNDGEVNKILKIGNGLTGMKERIELLSGKIAFYTQKNSFKTQIEIPMVTND